MELKFIKSIEINIRLNLLRIRMFNDLVAGKFLLVDSAAVTVTCQLWHVN